ncbi:MAG: hypothetical protein GF353_25360 [Candidatus Lokiarchaeota archaeon]|nr:hypothetical protein [Candidatus Lokiarchaeota archaeon]
MMRVIGHAVHGEWCGSRVFPIRCRYCDKSIYLFTCNCGCSVLFDDLGVPWPKHLCAEYLIDKFGFSRSQIDSLVNKRAEELGLEIPEIDHLFQEKIVQKKSWDDPIKKINPEENGKKDVVGMIREIVDGINPYKKLCVQRGSIAESQLGKIIPAIVKQITIHAGMTGESQIESYTFWISSDTEISNEIHRGDIVSAKLKSFSVLGCDIFWLADSMSILD